MKKQVNIHRTVKFFFCVKINSNKKVAPTLKKIIMYIPFISMFMLEKATMIISNIIIFLIILISSFLDPKLTTVHRPLYELGVTAAETLLHMMAGGESKKIVLPTHLIQRESCIKNWIV